MVSRLRFALLAGTAALGLTACSAQYRTHGYVPREDDLLQIVPGIDTRATVEDVIGVPSAAGVSDQGGFYYIESQVRSFAWQEPEIVDRQVLAITFDGQGVVDNITRYGLQDGQVVPLTRRITRTNDGEIGFIRKLFGNIGGLTIGDM
ncbi:outer membrane protein assembly factor BamE [Salipiger mangrovisoli]|uniref:Outer membrane protein assembly factor BamE n=1 Tax=Salipiger mangrovisoli TaxID=2865933 RepID=A0ABR9X3K3_9RHOB|nr:outer membrane protein assembly factor BamE [Salipiger mangrovisoli]MBE9638155.1 outer membrane protein assembly factor BamE [Salipiger mangrovisoli]